MSWVHYQISTRIRANSSHLHRHSTILYPANSTITISHRSWIVVRVIGTMMDLVTMAEEVSSQDEVVEMEAVVLSHEVVEADKVATSHKQLVSWFNHSTHRVALQLSEASMVLWVVEVPEAEVVTITFMVAVAMMVLQVSPSMV